MLQIKRPYDAYEETDGYRILVDRLWPRGISKERAHLDEWDKDITPTTEIRVQFGHKETNFDWFKEAYIHELDNNPHTKEWLAHIKKLLKKGNVSLIYAAKDPKINHAIILKEYTLKHLKK